LEIAKLAVETGLWPMYDMEYGEITQVRRIKDPRPVEEYLRTQKRFKHLFTMEGGEEEIQKIQDTADWNIKHYDLK
jgi:pyruvate ferredoxin oxidoreductase beta subunit